MGAKKARRIGLSIYLIKNSELADEVIVKLEAADAPIDVDLGSGTARLYVKTERVRPYPPWTELFTGLPDFPDGTFGRPNSVGAVLLHRGDTCAFLLSFGSGHHLVQEDAIQRDFGLRVTLNSVNPNELRSLDKASYHHNPLNSRTQSSRGVDIFDMAIDGESEMLYAVTGASQDVRLGTRVTGRDALNIQVEVEPSGIPELLAHVYKKYGDKLPPEFDWVDNVSRVRDADISQTLDLLVDEQLANDETASFWLGEPEIVDWDVLAGYSFDLLQKTGMQPILSMEKLSAYLADKGDKLTVETLRKQKIHLLDSNFTSLKFWSAYRCLHAEVHDGTDTYILRNGLWFKVKTSFVEQINEFVSGVAVRDLKLPEYAHNDEGAYNLHVASNDASFECMDKKLVNIGGPYDKVEFCDLIKDQTTLVHVKYYRSSSTLSHLFSQGHVAAEAFVMDEAFRVRLNQKLPESCKLADPRTRPDANQYNIVYAIATNKQLPNDLPFFSKVTLKNAVRTLRGLNFGVELTRIPVSKDLPKKTKYRGS